MVLLGTCFSISLAEINKQLRTDFKYICNQKDNKEVNSDKSDNICEKAVACPHQMLSRNITATCTLDDSGLRIEPLTVTNFRAKTCRTNYKLKGF